MRYAGQSARASSRIPALCRTADKAVGHRSAAACDRASVRSIRSEPSGARMRFCAEFWKPPSPSAGRRNLDSVRRAQPHGANARSLRLKSRSEASAQRENRTL